MNDPIRLSDAVHWSLSADLVIAICRKAFHTYQTMKLMKYRKGGSLSCNRWMYEKASL